jgi:hypothetical protein
MRKAKTIQWKAIFRKWNALLMLTAFTANFAVFCHCNEARAEAAPAASSPPVHSCCEKTSKSCAGTPDPASPLGCQGMQAMKFNLLEKQLTATIHPAAPPVISVIYAYVVLPAIPSTAKKTIPYECGANKHAPPDLLALYQRFLI